MSISRHHADWLSLVEVSGPFVSLPVLLRVFPQGLDQRDPAQAKALRSAHDEWHDNPAAPGKQRAWVLHVLTALLGYPQDQITEGQKLPAGLEAEMPEMGETLRPDFALVGHAGNDTAGHAQLLIASYTVEQALDKPVIGKHWKATPATRMMELLHGAGVSLGLVTNGEHWMLVYAPRGGTTGYASWYGSLWLDEPITLRAFHSLLGVHRFFGVAIGNTLLALLKESASDQQEVTDQLGYQVREAVKVLVESFDALDKDSNRALLTGVNPPVLYDAALTIMMRLVFLFSAEERGLLHLGKPLYDDNYAVSTLQEQLQEVADRYGEEVLERRYDAWARLLATFRAVHGGIQHQDLLMQAYGGSLFDPDRYPFLEGRSAGSAWRSVQAEPLAVNNRVVLHLLNSLQRLRTKVGGAAETRRVSFRALGVEQIGHVYEGLLDHTAARASEPVLGIKGTRSKEPEIPLATLESLLGQGQDKLIAFLKEETGRSLPAIRRTLEEGSLLDEHKLLMACNQDHALLARLISFAGIIREDSFERPLVVLAGSVYVTAGTTRRSTGTHYTPPSLTEPIVQHTLEPLVYEGPAEGWPREQWKLRSPKAILDLKVCDMAMGSGAFLVQACRYLAERLTEAWENEEKKHPGEVLITPDGKFSEGAPSERLVPADANERIAIARRVVADRCLYGVDINPMAVEMAKLSLWLITVDANRPFTFLDHAFKCGDSLLGITSLEQLENFSLRPGGGKQQTFSTLNLWRHIDEAKKKREVLEEMPSDTPEQIAAKAALYAEAEDAVSKLKVAADALITLELKNLKGRIYDQERQKMAHDVVSQWSRQFCSAKDTLSVTNVGLRTFHWELEFPEAFNRNGFDGFIGNPPFLGGSKISLSFNVEYRDYLVREIAHGEKGKADYCAYFLLHASVLLNQHGCLGLIVTNSVSQGDTRNVSLDRMASDGRVIYRADTDINWPGQAGVTVSMLWLTHSTWKGLRFLDGRSVAFITSFLTADGTLMKPERLKKNESVAFRGTEPKGLGFVLTFDEANLLIRNSERNKEVIFPYITGQDLYSEVDLSPTRMIINFHDWALDKAKLYEECFDRVTKLVKPGRDTITKQIHEPDYWKFWDKRLEKYKGVSTLNRVLARSYCGNNHAVAFLPLGIIYDTSVVVFGLSGFDQFAILQSTFHELWARTFGPAAMRNDMRYATKLCFETYPFPTPCITDKFCNLAEIGERYYQHRQLVMHSFHEGLTKIYNRFHDQTKTDEKILRLRLLHAEIDSTVVAAYGWQDLDLDHGFHETKQGVRFTISEAARREVLDRLLALNHQRHAEEEAERAAQSAATPVKRGRKKKDASDNQLLIDL